MKVIYKITTKDMKDTKSCLKVKKCYGELDQEVSCRAAKNGKEPKWLHISEKKDSARTGIRKKFVN